MHHYGDKKWEKTVLLIYYLNLLHVKKFGKWDQWFYSWYNNVQKCYSNIFTNETWKSVHEHKMKCSYIKIELEFGVMVFVERGKPKNPEKNPQGKDENRQKINQSS